MPENRSSYGSTPDSSFASQYRRILAATSCRTQVQLAKVLDVSQAVIADARRRKAVPSEWLVTLYEKKRVNPEWIHRGTGAPYIKAKNELPPVDTVVEVRPPEECSAQDLVDELVRRALKRRSTFFYFNGSRLAERSEDKREWHRRRVVCK